MKRKCPVCSSENLVFDFPIVKTGKRTPQSISYEDPGLSFLLEVSESKHTYKQYCAPIKGNFCADCGFVMLNIDNDLAKDLKQAKEKLDKLEDS